MSYVPGPSQNGHNIIGTIIFKPPEISAMNVKTAFL
jgi:hypothetical protein